MKLTDRLVLAKREASAEGREPKTAYFGKSEVKEMVTIAKSSQTYRTTPVEEYIPFPDARWQFMGFSVYLVDAESHLVIV